VGMWPIRSDRGVAVGDACIGSRDIRKVFSTPFWISSTRRAPAFVVKVVVAAQRCVLECCQGRIVGHAEELGRIGLPSSLVKVCPSSSPRCRWPPAGDEDLVEETAEARPLSIAGPLNAPSPRHRRSSRFFAIAIVFSATVFCRADARRFGLECSTRKRSIPSAARVRATITSRANLAGVSTRAPSEDTK